MHAGIASYSMIRLAASAGRTLASVFDDEARGPRRQIGTVPYAHVPHGKVPAHAGVACSHHRLDGMTPAAVGDDRALGRRPSRLRLGGQTDEGKVEAGYARGVRVGAESETRHGSVDVGAKGGSPTVAHTA